MKKQKNQLITAGIILCFSLLLLGCKKERIVFEEQAGEYLEDTKANLIVEEVSEEISKTEVLDQEETLDEVTDFGMKEGRKEETVWIAVHICGAVVSPAVYEMELGTRLYQAIELAGGFREEAEKEYLNLAAVLEDGMQIVVPTKEEVLKLMEERRKEDFMISSQVKEQEEKESKIDINTADEKELCTLPGIGEGRARAIIQYRTENGPFQNVEDIMKVSGIKESAYSKIKELITVLGR